MIFVRKLLFSSIIACSFAQSTYAKNLENMTQDFVLETKQIVIPQFPHAFNASIVNWKGHWLMSFRFIKDTQNLSSIASSTKSGLGLVWLNEDFIPEGNPQFIFFDSPDKNSHMQAEDVRLIAKGEKLYLIYSGNKEKEITEEGFRVFVGELEYDEGEFYFVNNECLSHFEGANSEKREKNWVPFIHEDNLLLTYQMNPHKIFYPLLNGSGVCETIATTFPSLVWEWGELRGGTPALAIDEDHYLGVFHSSTLLSTDHSKGQLIPHYFMGAYLFSSTPPFEIKYISPEPIVGPNFYQGLSYEPYWHPVCVVFPCGLSINDKEILITYGRQDHEIWIAKLDKKQLLDSLIQVSSLPIK